MTPDAGGSGGIVAGSHDGVTSGVDFVWWRRLHVGATSWLVLAQTALNPFLVWWPGNR